MPLADEAGERAERSLVRPGTGRGAAQGGEHAGFDAMFEQVDGTLGDADVRLDSAYVDRPDAKALQFGQEQLVYAGIDRLVDDPGVAAWLEGQLELGRTPLHPMPAYEPPVQGVRHIEKTRGVYELVVRLALLDGLRHVPGVFVDEAVLDIDDEQAAFGCHRVSG